MKFQSIRDWIFYPEDPRALALVRIVMMLGALLFFHSDQSPFIPEVVQKLPEFQPQGVFLLLPGTLSPDFLSLVQKIWMLSCFFVLIGFRTRLFLWIAFLSGIVTHGYSHNFYRSYHHSQVFVTLIFVLALSRCGDAWSVDRWLSGFKIG